ncbi:MULTISPECIES: glycosyltransferase [unclassified Neptuniibacter]|uniref:glycosyltransferase n=1 Tax=unclassified Neptuniibacter TaxID=2630693 RepID=UPI0025D19750|nr:MULTISPECIES: glycosyltransferase [unclassified Neptuniibacter]
MKKKVLVYAGTLRSGGGGSVLDQIVDYLIEEKRDFVIYLGDKKLLSEYEKRGDIPLSSVNGFFSYLSPAAVYFISKVYFLFRSFLKRDECVVLSFNQYIPSVYNNYVYHINLLSFMTEDGIGAKIRRFDAKKALQYAKKNIFESNYLKDIAVRYTGVDRNDFSVIHVCLNSEFKSVGGRGEKKEAGKIIAVTSPAKHKNNNFLYECIRSLKNKRPDINWKLCVVGGQDLKSWEGNKDYAEAIGVETSVEFLGPLTRTELQKKYITSFCMINSSKVESMYMVVLEAMSSGCPCVLADNSSARESMGNVYGLFKDDDPNVMAEMVIALQEDSSLYKKTVEEGLKHVQYFSKERFIKEFSLVIE